MTRRFSLIIPALDEARRLPATLRAAQAAFGDAAEYVIADGGSTDPTTSVAASFGARVLSGPRGRGEQLHRGFCAAQGEVCVFVHADTLLPRTACADITRALNDAAVVGGAFSLRFDETAKVGLLLRVLERAINVRSRWVGTATGDQVIFARTAVLNELGGVPRVPLFEDVRLCSALKRRGRFVILRECVTTSPRLWTSLGTARGIMLHLVMRALHALGASPRLLARYYPSPR